MPHPKANVTMTGDTHLPDLQPEIPLEDGAPGAVGADTEGVDRRRELKGPIGSIDNPNDGSGPERTGPSDR